MSNVLREAHGRHICQLDAVPGNHCPLLKQKKKKEVQGKENHLTWLGLKVSMYSAVFAQLEESSLSREQGWAPLGTTTVQARL